MIRAVIDTNVLFEGLTDAEGDDALVVDAWYLLRNSFRFVFGGGQLRGTRVMTP